MEGEVKRKILGILEHKRKEFDENTDDALILGQRVDYIVSGIHESVSDSFSVVMWE